jgi:citrate:succinate antiporter
LVKRRVVLALIIAANVYAFAFASLPSAIIVVAISSVVLFSTEALPPVTASFLLLILLSLHLPRADQGLVFSGFQSSLLYFLIAVTGVGQAVARSGLGCWFMDRLQKMMTSSRLPLPVLMCLSFFPLSFILPSSVTRNAMLKPLFVDFLRRNDAQEEAKRVGLTLGILNALASSALLTGGLAPMVAASTLGGFGWVRWFATMAVPYYLLMSVGVGYLLLRYPVRPRPVQTRPAVSERMPPLARRDWYVLGVLILMVGLWVTDSWHGLPAVVPAMVGFVLFLLGDVLEWETLKETRAWDTVIVLGALLSLVESMRRTGVLEMLTTQLGLVLPAQWPVWALLLCIMLATVAINLLIPSITVCLTLLLPLFIQLAGGLGLSPVLVGLMITMTVDSVKFYPTQSTPLLMVYDRQDFGAGDVARMGVVMLVALAVLLLTVFVPYWRFVGVI